MSLNAPISPAIDGSKLRFGIVAARFNQDLVDTLLARLTDALRAAGVKPASVRVERVPGSHEVPWGIARFAARGRYDCLIALGVLIGGDTNHHEMVGQSVSHALQRVAVDRDVPVINGVIVTDTLEQAKARCTGRINRGAEFAHAALTMADLNRRLGGKS
jgi:6,7-dimethyl-8-ribityllumazine synthase